MTPPLFDRAFALTFVGMLMAMLTAIESESLSPRAGPPPSAVLSGLRQPGWAVAYSPRLKASLETRPKRAVVGIAQ